MFEGSVSSGGGNNQAQFQTTSHSQGRNDNYIVQSSTKGRGLRDGSPTGAKGYIHQQTPFFQLENTDHKNHQYSGYSVKEFSLGKPQKFRSTYKKNQLFQKTEDQANPSSKDSVIPNKENLQPKLINSLNELKRIRNEFVKVIEQEISEKNKHNQVEYAALNDDITLLLNDDTRINNSFINESHQKPGTLTASISPLSNTPSKSPTPSRFIPELGGSRGMPPRGGERSKSNQFVGMLPQHLHSSQPANTLTRKEDGLYMMTNSQLMTSLDRAEATGFAPLTGQQRGYNTTPDRHSASPKGFNGNDSFLNKSQDFPKMLKRKASRPYTKVLIPFMIDKDRDSEYIDPVLAGLPTSPSRSNPSQEWRIFDLFKVQRFVKKEFSNEYYEGLCLIRGQKRPVLIRRTTDQSAVMREIMMNLVFYENEVNFSAVSILKMRDFFNTNGHFHVIYDRPGDWLLHSEVIASGLSEQVCMSMAADLAKTIGLIHSLGIVHSKLCPESLYLAYDSGNTSSAGNPNGGMGYRLRVSDFEHAFFEGEHTDKIVPSNYSAPEVIFAAPGSQRTQDESHALGINFNGSPISGFGDDSFIRGTTSQGRIQVDRRSDYWSVGCLLYFLGTGGSHLFPAKSRLRTGYLIEKLLSSGSNMMGVPSPGFTQTKPSFPEEMVYLYPGYADKLSKLTSEVRTELDAVAAETSFKLEELRNSKPALFRVISDCLKLNPEER